MESKIDGIALYPLNLMITDPDGQARQAMNNDDTIENVSCSLESDRQIALEQLNQDGKLLQRGFDWHLVCAVRGAPEALSDILVGGTLTSEGGKLFPLDLKSLHDQQVGDDGSFRVFWEWPKYGTYVNINHNYRLALTLSKRQNTGNPTPVSASQTFTIKFIQKRS
jgi:hypothetical protein